MGKGKLLCALLCVFALQGVFSASPVAFTEIWGYLLSGEERYLDKAYPVTDIGYFGAGLSVVGTLTGVPDRSRLGSWEGRAHLVVAEVSNQALTHFCLDPAFNLRYDLVQAIVKASAPYDGVQIDFETVLERDKEHFITFLAAIKAMIGEKTLSVALPARTRKVNDAYDYERISRIADRIVIMAYDEHWSGSRAGPIASLDWCRKVAAYSLGIIPREKLVMGMPFYGRAWADTNPAKAFKYSTLTTLIADKKIPALKRAIDIPWFEYKETVNVTVYFEDSRSISAKSLMYVESGVQNVSFWRLGQEDIKIWKELNIR